MGSEARLSGGESRAGSTTVVLATAASGARGSDALAAALATCAADEQRAALLVELGGGSRPRRPTLLASPAARRCEAELRDAGVAASARGLICHVAIDERADGLDRAAQAINGAGDCAVCILHVEAALWLAALDHPGLAVKAAVIRAELPRDRSLAALAVRDLRARGLAVRVALHPIGWAAGRRALAGVRIGGADQTRLRRWTAALLGAVNRRSGPSTGSIRVHHA